MSLVIRHGKGPHGAWIERTGCAAFTSRSSRPARRQPHQPGRKSCGSVGRPPTSTLLAPRASGPTERGGQLANEQMSSSAWRPRSTRGGGRRRGDDSRCYRSRSRGASPRTAARPATSRGSPSCRRRSATSPARARRRSRSSRPSRSRSTSRTRPTSAAATGGRGRRPARRRRRRSCAARRCTRRIFELLTRPPRPKGSRSRSRSRAGTRSPTRTPSTSAASASRPAVVSVPLRYMHTPVEIVDLDDVEAAVRLLVAFAARLEPGVVARFTRWLDWLREPHRHRLRRPHAVRQARRRPQATTRRPSSARSRSARRSSAVGLEGGEVDYVIMGQVLQAGAGPGARAPGGGRRRAADRGSLPTRSTRCARRRSARSRSPTR